MKLSTSITLMFREFDPATRIAEAAKAGFAGVEIQVLEDAPDKLAAAAKESGISVALINAPMGDFLQGGAGLSGAPGKEAEFEEAFDLTLMAAKTLGCSHLHVGPSCSTDDTDRDAGLACLKANLVKALQKVEGTGITLLIEPINRKERPTALLGSTGEVAEFIAYPALAGIGILYDIYHSVLSDEDPIAMYDQHKDRIAHIQFSDAPGRTAPGGGSIPFADILSHLKTAGYDGWLGAEYFAPADTLSTFGWMKDFA